MWQMKKEKTKSTKVKKRMSMSSRAHVKKNRCRISIVTEKGEELTYRIAGRRRIYRIEEKGPYTHLRITGIPRVASKIKLYGKAGAVNGTIKKINNLSPSTDVEPGDVQPIKKPGGH